MAESVIGYGSLMGRLRAMQNPALAQGMLGKLQLSVVREAKIAVPHRTRNLSRSIHPGRLTPEYAEVIASAGYAAFVEFGTRPHEIRPVNRKALRWAATSAGARLTGTPRKAAQRGQLGGVMFAKIVHHPGTSPNPYMERAVQVAVTKAHLEDVIIAAWNSGGAIGGGG